MMKRSDNMKPKKSMGARILVLVVAVAMLLGFIVLPLFQ